MTIVDVGAHVGYFTMIMAKKVGSSGAIHSFEPRDLNRNFLKRHIRSNGISNVTVYSQCVGDQYGKVMFEERTGTGTGHISSDGNVEVDMVTLDGMVAEGKIPVPDMLKIDVEGAEILVLNGARETISSRKPKMVLAVHSDELERQCREILEPLGYTFTDLGQEKGDKEFLVQCS
jgi:FkbM family methyltransferase